MNIAVFLPNWIGDAVMATPAVRALRDHYRRRPPRRRRQALRRRRARRRRLVRRADLLPRRRLGAGRRWPSRGSCGAQRIDLAVLFPNSFRSALTAWLGGCRRRIGYARYGRSLLLTDALPPVRDADGRLTPSPVLDAYNLLAERAGCPRPAHGMELFTTPADEAAADARLGAGRLRRLSAR